MEHQVRRRSIGEVVCGYGLRDSLPIRERSGKPGLNVILGVSNESIERNVLQPMREIYTEELVGTINSRNVARICGEDAYCLVPRRSARWPRSRSQHQVLLRG